MNILGCVEMWICDIVPLQNKKNAFFLNFFAKNFGKGKMFDVSLSSKSEMTKSQYGHVHDANVVRTRMIRVSFRNPMQRYDEHFTFSKFFRKKIQKKCIFLIL